MNVIAIPGGFILLGSYVTHKMRGLQCLATALNPTVQCSSEADESSVTLHFFSAPLVAEVLGSPEDPLGKHASLPEKALLIQAASYATLMSEATGSKKLEARPCSDTSEVLLNKALVTTRSRSVCGSNRSSLLQVKQMHFKPGEADGEARGRAFDGKDPRHDSAMIQRYGSRQSDATVRLRRVALEIVWLRPFGHCEGFGSSFRGHCPERSTKLAATTVR